MRRSTITLALLASTACFAAQPAIAQQAAPAALEEIVVTAQRRAENMQEVPIAVAAITAATAERLGINQAQSLSQFVPGLNMNMTGAGLVPFLRGIGSNNATVGNEPSVAMFVDDVYVPSGTGAVFEFNNIDSIEVLKGPQGTLFGRNATGGVIHVKTRNPTYEPTVNVTGGYANYQTFTGQFYGSAGLSETVAANLALYGTTQGKGWGKTLVTGNDVSFTDAWGARVKVLADLSDDTSLLLTAAYDRKRSSIGNPMRALPGTFGLGGYSPERAGAGFYDSTSNFDSIYLNRTAGGSAKLSHDAESFRVVSITAYSKLRSNNRLDIDGTPATFFDAGVTASSAIWTQELQVLSPVDSAIDWIVGGFFLHDRAVYMPDLVGSIFGGGRGGGKAVQVTKSFSGFAQASAEIMPRTNMTIGLRYTHDNRAFDALATLRLPSGALVNYGPFKGDKSFSSLTGRFALDYRVSDDVMVYAAYNRGFKSGVWNIAGVSVGTASLPPAVNPEELNAYSVGLKSELADRRVRLNVEAYLYDYKNIQVSTIIPGGTMLTNGGAATMKGIDADITVVPVQNLTLTANLAVAKGTYDRFLGGPRFFPQPPNAPVPITPGCPNVPPYPTAATPLAQVACDLSGNDTIQTPPFTSTLIATYRIPMQSGDIDLSGSWTRGGNYFFEPDNSPGTKQGRTNIINASAQWTSEGGRYTARLWGRNLTGKKYYSYISETSSGGLKYSPSAPRTYGVTLGFNM